MTRYWRCRRVTAGQVCGELNLAVKKKCYRCGKPKPPKRRPKHTSALKLNYVEYVKLNGDEKCGICGALPKPGRRLNRDHDHKTGQARGLLCHPCNRFLVLHRYGLTVTADWLRSAAAYLEQAKGD